MKRSILETVFMILLLAAGLGFLLYPSVVNYTATLTHINTVSDYNIEVAEIDTSNSDAMIAATNDYNNYLLQNHRTLYEPTEEEHAQYENILNTTSSGIMGYVTIPKISLSLPIYHGSNDKSLQQGVGHLEGTSVPVSGMTTSHVALSGHSGLPSDKMFNDIRELEEGDTFYLTILNDKLYYEVDQISVVLPDDTSAITFDEGMNYCSLITCTPYGVNSHRLIVRGHSIPAPDTILDEVTPLSALENDHSDIFIIIGAAISSLAIIFILARRTSVVRNIVENFANDEDDDDF